MKLSIRKRKTGTKTLGDPEGVMATLQVARRLIAEWGNTAVYPALEEALPMSAPKDRGRAWWGAHREVNRALPAGYSNVGDWLLASPRTHAEVLSVFDAAIKAYGGQLISEGSRK